MKQTAVSLPDATYDRLRALAESSGCTPTFHILQALERYLEDTEDLRIAEQAAAEHRHSGGRSFSLDEQDNYLAVED